MGMKKKMHKFSKVSKKSTKTLGKLAKKANKVDYEKVGVQMQKAGKVATVVGAGITAVAPEAGIGEGLMAAGAATQASGRAVQSGGRAKKKAQSGDIVGAVGEVQKGVVQAKKDKKNYNKKYA